MAGPKLFSIVDLRLERVAASLTIANRQSKIENVVVPVAQPDRASDFGSEGWGFESLQARGYNIFFDRTL